MLLFLLVTVRLNRDYFSLTKDALQLITDILDLDTNNNWFLYYEAVEVKKWISAIKRADFSVFSSASISFYDPAKAIIFFDLPE